MARTVPFLGFALLIALTSGQLQARPIADPVQLKRPAALRPVPLTLDQFLARLPAVKSRIVWQAANGGFAPYDAWSLAMKQRLADLFLALGRGDASLGLRLPSSATVSPGSGAAYFTFAQAFDVYAAHVAHALHLEAHRLVPWSLALRPACELDAIFASRSYFAPIGRSQNVDYPAGIVAGRDYQEAPQDAGLGELNGDPRVGFRFVTGETSASRRSLVGPDELETLVNLTVWLRDNVGHGNIPADKDETHRFLEDRLAAHPGDRTATANHGCHSASKLFTDLARSVNIPLLHVRTQEKDATSGYFFNRTHGGLIYGWGGPDPRILWHTDEIYAMPGEPPFPLDPAGALLPADLAAKAYFANRWRRPAELAAAGFVYSLQMAYPEQGFGVSSRGAYEDRSDYGWMAGYWKSKGTSSLAALLRLEESYALCGAFLLGLEYNRILSAQLDINLAGWRGSYTPAELPPSHTMAEFEARVRQAFTALGGPEGYKSALDAWTAARGSNLLRPARHLPVKVQPLKLQVR